MTNHRMAQQVKWMLWAVALVLVCTASQLPKASDALIVRAILLSQNKTEYQVGVLYQEPEAAANSADAQAPLKMIQSKGNTLSDAFQSLEQKAEAPVSYQLSDYLLLCGQCDQQTLAAYAKQVQATQRGRYAAKISYVAQNIDALEPLLANDIALAQEWLETLQTEQAPYLYQGIADSVVMPFFEIKEEGVQPVTTMYLLDQNGAKVYNEMETTLYRLLSNTKDCCYFSSKEISFRIQHRVLSYEGSLTGVSSNKNSPFATFMQTKQSSENAALGQNNKTLLLYALVDDAEDTSETACVNMELYLTYLIYCAPRVMEQLDINRVEVHLACLA